MREWIFLRLTLLTGFIASRSIPSVLRVTFFSLFAKSVGIDLNECEKPLKEYVSFDDFFTRRLKPGCRPIAMASDILVSPVDGLVLETGQIFQHQLIQAKGIYYPIDDLLPEIPSDAFEGGYFMTLYLSPKDCHLIFSPCDGQITFSQYVPGTLLPVREPYISKHRGLYIENERLTTLMTLADGKKLALVKVGATNVGSITLEYDPLLASSYQALKPIHRQYSSSIHVSKGDHLASFHLGSTVIVMIEKDSFVLDRELKGKSVRYGSEIGSL